MSDDFEPGPDLNDYRRHARKMFTEKQYREKYCRLHFYKPTTKQLDFHNSTARFRMLRAGNQLGKSTAGAAELAMHSCLIYPDWFKGRTFLTKPKIERPFDFLGWVAAPTGQKIRDGMQGRLLGNIRGDQLGTGYIPLDNLSAGRIAMTRGISDEVDFFTLRREDGGTAVIREKTHAQGRQSFEGESCDEIILDEDIKGEDNEPIFNECIARLTATNGNLMHLATPLLGLTPLRKFFKERAGIDPSVAEILMTIDDCLTSVGGHIDDSRLEELKSQYKSHQAMTRLYGTDMMGEGLVFETPVEAIKQNFNWREFPDYFRWIWGLDFRHSGNLTTGHPFAAVLIAHDPENDKAYVVEAIRMLGSAPEHASRMKQHRHWRAPCSYPHDGGKGASITSGDTIASVYRKEKLNMLPSHATFSIAEGGGYNFESGITMMENRLSTDRLVVSSHLHQWFDEYGSFFRRAGLVVKENDDLLSATRIGLMSLRFAKTPERFENFGANPLARDPRMRFAKGSAFHPDGPYDLFKI